MFIVVTLSAAVGSPPRMRGKDKTPQKGLKTGRITPAYAGKSKETLDFCILVEDHPRVCGEKSAAASC